MVDTADSSLKLPIKNGELWCGDCLDVMRDIPSGSVDMILCDLPYGTTQNKWDSVIPFEPLWSEYWRICRGPVVLTAAQPFTSALVMSQVEYFKHEWVWIKNAGSNFMNAKREPMKEHENIIVFARSNWTYNGQMQERSASGKSRVKTPIKHGKSSTNYNESEERISEFSELRVPSSWQKFNRERGLHPTQKPVALFEYLIRTYTNEGDTVMDNCLGSGTTAIAAENTGRRWIGIERDLTYCMSAWDRVMKHQPSSLRTTM